MKKIIFILFTFFPIFSYSQRPVYCDASGGTCNPQIESVQILTALNNTTVGCVDGTGYSDFSSIAGALVPGNQYTINVAAGPAAGSAYYYVFAWIDWNIDGVYSEDEQITLVKNNSGATFTGVINVDAGIALGLTGMRLRVLDNLEQVNNTTPCGIGLGGEVEDYTIELTDTPPPSSGYCDAKGTDFCGTLTTNATDPTAPPDTSDTYIINVRLIGDNGTEINNTSTRPDCRAGQGYSDYSHIFAEVGAGGTYALEVTRAVNYAFGQAAVWVDWNDDKVFDATEYVETGAPVAAVHTMTITPPAGVISTGYKRMRIRTRLGPGASFAPCGEQTGGEVEDYSLLYIDPVNPTPNCVTLNSPADAATNFCTTTPNFTWTAPAGGEAATGYKFYLGTDNPPTTLANGTDVGLNTSYQFGANLLANTTYYWSVVAYNDNGDALDCDIWEFTTAMNIDPSIDQILLGGNDVDSATVCADVDLAILANISGGTGTVDFAWTGDDIHLNDNSINNPIFNASTGSQTYKLRLTAIDDNNCTARDSVKVYVKDAPVVGILSADKSAVCPNETVTLTLTGYNATITDWEKAEGANPYASINHTQDVLATTINVDTQFKVLLTNGEGCEGESNEVSVTLNAAPSAPTIAVNPSNTACEGETITLTATPGTDVVWNDASNSTTGSIAVTTGGSYNVTYTDPTSGCSATSTDESITFNALPASPVISISGATCEGETVTLSTQYLSDLSWDLDGSGTASTATIDVTQDGTYAVTYTDVATNCSSTSAEQIAFNAKPTAPVIEQSGDSLITNPTQIVNWLDADGNVVETAESYSPDRTPGQTFTAVVVDGNNCESDESNEIAYDHTVSITTYNQIGFAVFPNPATSELNVQVNSSSVAGMYHIKDMAGRTVIAVELVRGVNTISLAEIQSGIYILQDNVGNTIRIVKQ